MTEAASSSAEIGKKAKQLSDAIARESFMGFIMGFSAWSGSGEEAPDAFGYNRNDIDSMAVQRLGSGGPA